MKPKIDFNRKLSSERVDELQQLFNQFSSNPSLLALTTLRSRTDQILNQHCNPQSAVQLPSTRGRSSIQSRTAAPTASPSTTHQAKNINKTQTGLTSIATQTVCASQPTRSYNSRKRNIIIHGLTPSSPNPTNKSLKADAQAFLFTKLHLSIEPQSVQLLGSGTSKPFRVRFKTIEDKKNVFRNCHLLKPYKRDYRITPDFTYEQRQKLKLILPRLNFFKKEKGCKVRIKNFILFVNGVPEFPCTSCQNYSCHCNLVNIQNENTNNPESSLGTFTSATQPPGTLSAPQRPSQPPPLSPSTTSTLQATAPSTPARTKRRAPLPSSSSSN